MTSGNELPNTKVLVYSSIVLGILGAALFGFGVYFIVLARESNSWVATPAKVTEGRVKSRYMQVSNSRRLRDSDKEYHYEITYSYEVNGVPFSSDRFSLGDGSRASSVFREREEAQAELRETYPKGSDITVYVDPENPASVVVSQGLQWSTYVPLILGIVFLSTAYLTFLASKLPVAKPAQA